MFILIAGVILVLIFMLLERVKDNKKRANDGALWWEYWKRKKRP